MSLLKVKMSVRHVVDEAAVIQGSSDLSLMLMRFQRSQQLRKKRRLRMRIPRLRV